MAEERLIDEDKDRKYKIRKNADGEDELYIDDSAAEEEEEPVFAVPDFGEEDDEEAAVLTPEQLLERERLRAEEELAKKRKILELLSEAEQKIEEGDFETALYCARRAEELDENDGATNCLKLRALTREFTTYNSLDDCAEAADKIRLYAGAEDKAQLKSLCSPIVSEIAAAEKTAAALGEENEVNKARRREVFEEEKKKTLKVFASAACAFLILFVLTLALSFIMFSDENGVYLVVTCALAGITVLALIATAVTARFFLRAQRNLKVNEKDSSTELGRKVLESRKRAEILNKILSSFSEEK